MTSVHGMAFMVEVDEQELGIARGRAVLYFSSAPYNLIGKSEWKSTQNVNDQFFATQYKILQQHES